MTDKAAFTGTYSDWKVIKTRRVVQIIIEVPIEAAGHAYNVMGGMPRFDNEEWFVVARMKKPE